MNTVLIVEDEKLIRQGIRAMIQRSGVPVSSIVECGNGQMALEILQEQKIDVMFTDIRMPKMDGIELVERMRGLPDAPMTVVISGYDDFSYAIQMMRSGVKEYILKPVEREQITAIMRRLEEELEEKKRSQRKLESLELQQLRQLLVYGEGEFYNLEEFHILPGEFVVCCLERRALSLEPDQALLPGEIGQHYVVIADAHRVEYLLKNELRGSCVGISRVHGQSSELQEAYREAASARWEAFGLCSPSVVFEQKAEQTPEGGPDRENIEQIAQMLGTDKLEEALLRLDRMAADVRRGRSPVVLFAAEMSLLCERISEIYQNVLQEEQEELRELQMPCLCTCISEYMERLKDWCVRFQVRMNEEFDHYAGRQKMQQAIQYIQENFSGDLNMAMVSNHISMNYSLFSNTFKQYTGSNFVNYLKNLRINEAKRLLAETDLRIIEISQKVGYDNEKHFMKTFKSLCGVSPTEYRKNMQYQ